MSDWVVMERRALKREDWKMKFMDEVEMWYKRNSQESPSIMPDKTTPNSAYVV